MLIKSDEKQTSDELIDLSSYLQIIKKHYVKVLSFTLIITILSIVYALSLTPIYKSTATLKIEDAQNKVISIEQIVGIDSSQQDYYKTQYEILRSNRVAEKVINQLSLGNQDNNQLDSNQPIDKLAEEMRNQARLKSFKENLVISPIEDTHLVNISYYSEDPLLAKKIANAVGKAYIESFIETQMEANQQASEWINVRIAELEEQLNTSETKLAEFMNQEQLIDDEGIDTLAKNELNNLSKQLSDVRDRRVAAEALHTALQKNKNANLGDLFAMNQVSNHPQIRDVRRSIIDAEKALFEMSKRYGPKHDKMIRAKAQLRSLQNRSYKILKEMISGIEREFATIVQQEQAIEKQLNTKKNEFQNVTMNKATFESMTREVEANRQLYNMFLTRQKETSATSDFQVAVATFTDHARIPLYPAKPRKTLIVAISTLAALFIGFGLAFISHLLKNTFERRQDVEDVTGQTVLGSIPLVQLAKDKAKWLELYQENTRFAESIQSIRTSLMIKLVKKEIKAVAITSALNDEGKTTAAISLAKSLSNLERVLLIECELREPVLADRLNTSSSEGLVDHISTDQPLSRCIHRDETDSFDFIPAGMTSATPAEVLGSKKFRLLLDELSKQYDRIILDAPPINKVSDPILVCALVQHCLVVVKANSTKHSQLKFALTRLKKHDINIEGIILNQDESKTQDAYQYAGTYQ